MKTVLVVGATGATGRELVKQLLGKGNKVKAVVRSAGRLRENVGNHENLTVITSAVLDLTDEEMARHVKDCDAVASCLGHNVGIKGIYGKPHRLVTDTARRFCDAIRANNPEKPVRYVLMNTVAVKNHDLNEKISLGERIVFGLLRVFLPPHADNEKAADYLRTRIGQQDKEIEWVAVRPDGLVNEEKVSEYELHPSPLKSIFKPGTTSRINVGHFMAELITNDDLWKKWKGQMPVIYNKES
jgi:NAD(P)-dependent dehydrogenase (short-subunit alcohol dehydrogenase family)